MLTRTQKTIDYIHCIRESTRYFKIVETPTNFVKKLWMYNESNITLSVVDEVDDTVDISGEIITALLYLNHVT